MGFFFFWKKKERERNVVIDWIYDRVAIMQEGREAKEGSLWRIKEQRDSQAVIDEAKRHVYP